MTEAHPCDTTYAASISSIAVKAMRGFTVHAGSGLVEVEHLECGCRHIVAEEAALHTLAFAAAAHACRCPTERLAPFTGEDLAAVKLIYEGRDA